MIRLSIRTKLALLLGSLALLLILAIMLGVQASFNRGFQHYLNEAHSARMERMAAGFADIAQQNPEQWQRLQQDRRYLAAVVQSLLARDHNEQSDRALPAEEDILPDPAHQQPRSLRRAFSLNRLMPFWLLSPEGQVISGHPELPDEVLTATIARQGQQYGLLAWRPLRIHDFEAEALFAQQQHRLIMAIAAVTLLLCLLLAWPLSQYLVRPIQRLSGAMQSLMARQYDVQVPVSSRDELGELAEDFNRMARTLGEHDQSQRQWLADIAHELRTPLAVLRGQMEAMEDGVMALDAKSLASLQDEIRQLNGLVDDLHQLAITDLGALRYQFQPLDLAQLLRDLAERIRRQLQDAGLKFTLDLPTSPVWITGDRQRLEQMLVNLTQNSIRYTDAGGEVHVRLEAADPTRLIWEDSAPGVEDSDLPHLFERFYRVEKSRQRALGGSGLGLAIVANIVRAHQGLVEARHSALGGLCVELRIPVGKSA